MAWRDLNDTTQRAIIAFVVIVAILLILALFGYLTGGWNGSN